MCIRDNGTDQQLLLLRRLIPNRNKYPRQFLISKIGAINNKLMNLQLFQMLSLSNVISQCYDFVAFKVLTYNAERVQLYLQYTDIYELVLIHLMHFIIIFYDRLLRFI